MSIGLHCEYWPAESGTPLRCIACDQPFTTIAAVLTVRADGELIGLLCYYRDCVVDTTDLAAAAMKLLAANGGVQP